MEADCWVSLPDIGHAALACDGELHWVNVSRKKRGGGIADGMIAKIATWFVPTECTPRLRKR